MRSDNPTPNLPEIHSGSAHPEGPAPSEQAAMIEALQWAKTTMQDDDRPGDSPTRRADVARHLLTLDKIYELVRGRAAVGEPSYTRSLADSDDSSHKRDALGERPADYTPDPNDVERVAEAIWAASNTHYLPWHVHSQETKDYWRDLARAAMAALRQGPSS